MGSIAALIATALVAHCFRWLPEWLFGPYELIETPVIYVMLLGGFAITSIVLSITSHQFMSRWPAVAGVGLAFFAGLSPYVAIPIVAMTNPPSNWGYARTVEGFVNLIGSGQYERMRPMDLLSEFDRFYTGIWGYAIHSFKDVGWIYLLPALVPFFFLWRLRGRARGWIVGLIVCFLALSLFMLVMINPPANGSAWWVLQLYLLPSHLVLTIFAGYGLAFVGTVVARGKEARAE
jgi:hypothetical protein